MTNTYEFNEKNEVRGSFFSYGKPGDSIVGTLVSKEQVPDDFNPGKSKWKYTLKAKRGSFHEIVSKKVTGNVVTIEAGTTWIISGKADVDAGMQNIPYGNVVGIKFIEERASKRDSKRNTKVCKVYNFGPDPESENITSDFEKNI